MDKTVYTNHAKAWEYIDQRELALESPFVQHARALAHQAHLPSCSSAVGQFLHTIPVVTHASSIIIIGTGSLVETAQLIEGLHGQGKLTAVDSSGIGGTQLRTLFTAVEDSTRTTLRMVSAQPSQYLGRLNGDGYDMIVVCGEASNYMPAFAHAPRLLKQGGSLLFTDVLAMHTAHTKGGLTNPADRSEKALVMRELLAQVEEDEQFVSALIPAGTGILIAGYR